MTANVFAKVWEARFGLMLLAAFCITVLTASPSKANTPLTGPCPVVINQPGQYSLSKDLTCPPDVDGIDIEASNVTLLLAGRTIAGTCSGGIGIRVLGTSTVPLTTVGILGPGRISDFTTNFLADYSADSFVNKVKVESQCYKNVGFFFNTSSNHWALIRDVVRAPGARLPEGLVLLGPNNVVALCKIDDSIIVYSNNNVIVDNIANDSPLGGIYILGSNNQIYANTTKNNSDSDGIFVGLGALGNILSENKAFNNLPYDMEDDNPDCGTNIWEGNKFNAANLTCIH